MDRTHFLHVHLPGRGRVTLSLPGGIERAIIRGQLPADAQVWYDPIRLWISIARHPEVIRLLQRAALSLPSQQPVPVPPTAEEEFHDPAQLPLIPLEDFEPHHEFSRFLERSSAAEERRRAVRTSGPLRPSGPLRIFVAGAQELRKGQRRLQRLMARYQVPGWAAMLTLSLLGSLAVALFFVGRAAGSKLPIAPVTVTNALSANGYGADSISQIAVLVEPNPLAGEERELENNLRIAEAVVWQPAIDFSPEAIWRSARKMDAVRNSISLYRIGAWRQIDSASRDIDPRLEPFEEAVRVDEVLDVMQSAVTLLDSLINNFRVNGETLVFLEPDLAARYSWLRQRADSLLRIPVAVDSPPRVRAPRRIVTRLLETLPAAVVQTP
jgi:hypothetical protein